MVISLHEMTLLLAEDVMLLELRIPNYIPVPNNCFPFPPWKSIFFLFPIQEKSLNLTIELEPLITSHILPSYFDSMMNLVVEFDESHKRQNSRENQTRIVVVIHCVIVIQTEFCRCNVSL